MDKSSKHFFFWKKSNEAGKMDNIYLPSRENSIPYEDYEFSKYVGIDLWSSFYHQISEILTISSKTDSILEIGKGTGILGGVLKELGYSYESMDINPNLNPMHVGSVEKIPFDDNSFEVIGCFQVLEHLPYDKFSDALSELFRVANKAVIISLPNAKRAYPFYLYFPRILHKKILIPVMFYVPNNYPMDPDHHWEINRKTYNIRKVKEKLQNVAKKFGFSLKRDYRNWENSYHHFFIFYKQN